MSVPGKSAVHGVCEKQGELPLVLEEEGEVSTP